MGKKNQPETPPLRVVLDSNVVVSALLFRQGELACPAQIDAAIEGNYLLPRLVAIAQW